MYCWPEGFIPWLINLQFIAQKWSSDCQGSVQIASLKWSFCFHRRYSMSPQKKSILINEHALNREPVPLNRAASRASFCLFWLRGEKSGSVWIATSFWSCRSRLNFLTIWLYMVNLVFSHQTSFWSASIHLLIDLGSWKTLLNQAHCY